MSMLWTGSLKRTASPTLFLLACMLANCSRPAQKVVSNPVPEFRPIDGKGAPQQ